MSAGTARPTGSSSLPRIRRQAPQRVGLVSEQDIKVTIYPTDE
jgi:hypothetical protein